MIFLSHAQNIFVMTVITVNEIMSPRLSPIATSNVPNHDGNTGCALWCLNWDQPQFKSSVWFLFSIVENPVLRVRPLSPDHIMEILMDLVRKARSRNIGTLHPFFNINKCVRDGLQETLPDNVHQIISGKVYISLTRVSDGENVLVSEFHSKDEVVDVSVLPLWVWSMEQQHRLPLSLWTGAMGILCFQGLCAFT